MSFVEAVAQTLVEVAKDDLVAGQKYLMVDEQHAVVVEVRLGPTELLATPAASYLCGFQVVRFEAFRVSYVNPSCVRFFQLPA